MSFCFKPKSRPRLPLKPHNHHQTINPIPSSQSDIHSSTPLCRRQGHRSKVLHLERGWKRQRTTTMMQLHMPVRQTHHNPHKPNILLPRPNPIPMLQPIKTFLQRPNNNLTQAQQTKQPKLHLLPPFHKRPPNQTSIIT